MPDTGPVVVVTGGNRGIGYEVCRQLARQGYQVVLAARDPRKGELAAADLGAQACQLDVADDDSVRTAASWVADRMGRCDALVNNAAILYDTWARARSANLDEVLDRHRNGRPRWSPGRRWRGIRRMGSDTA